MLSALKNVLDSSIQGNEAATIPVAIQETPNHENSEKSLEFELRKCDVDFEELLKLKITGRGNALQDLKKRIEDQKNLILKLREGFQDRIFYF